MNTLRKQRGAMAITMALLLIGLIAMLGLIEVGYLYWAHRSTQKIADLAALSGAQQLDKCSPANVSSVAIRNATVDNRFSGDVKANCGYWSPSEMPAPSYFGDADDSHPANAVSVTASLPLTPFFGFAKFSGVSATAIAANHGDPIAAFSVGSRLLGVSTSAPLNQLLDSSLGTTLGLKLLSYDGVANTNISLLSLRDALNLDAGTVDGVLSAPVRIGDFLDAIVTLLENSDNAASINISAVSEQVTDIKAELGDTTIKLGDILNVTANTSDPTTALDAMVSTADLINAGLMAANSQHALEMDDGSIDLLGLAQIKLKLAVIEPPKIGVGPPGYDTDGKPLTVAHTAQIRLRIKATVAQALGNDNTLLSVPLVAAVILPSDGHLSTIPLNLEVVPAEAWLDSLQCHQPDNNGKVNIATIKARPGALNLFLGNLPDTTYDNSNERWEDIVQAAIDDKSAYANLLDIKLKLLLNLIVYRTQLQVYASAPVIRLNDAPHDFVFPDDQQPSGSAANWPIDTGQELLSSAFNAILSKNLLHLRVKTKGLGLVGSVTDALLNGVLTIVQNLLPILNPVLVPVFNALDTSLIGPLLKLLGVNVGAADIHLMSIHCNTGVQLVY